MRKIYFALLLIPFISFGQKYKIDFDASYNKKDYDRNEIKTILNNWKKESVDDVEYYIAAFNFYFRESQEEMIQLSQDKPQENQEALVLSDSLGNKSGFLYSQINSNDSLFTIFQNHIDEAIKLFPNRLDLRFGKIHTLGEVENYEDFTLEILKTINYSISLNHKWLWSENNDLEDSENFFIDAIQRYQNTLFQVESDDNLKKITKKMYEIFPNDLFVISSYGVTFLIEGKNKEALELYLKAEKINPNDTIVLNNIGLIYERLSDKKNALKYYQKITEVGDEQSKSLAEKKISQLK